MRLPNAHHPIWGIIKAGMVLVVLALFLKFNYRDFDHRDVVTLIGVAISMLGGGAIHTAVRSRDA